MKGMLNLLNRHERDRKVFMECVEQHERAWGNETYKGRPTLDQILGAQVVAFWHPTSIEIKPTITIHKSLDDISKYVTALVLHSDKALPVLRLDKVFVNKLQVKIKGVQVVFQKVPD